MADIGPHEPLEVSLPTTAPLGKRALVSPLELVCSIERFQHRGDLL